MRMIRILYDKKQWIILIIVAALVVSCTRSVAPDAIIWEGVPSALTVEAENVDVAANAPIITPRAPGNPIFTPTPDQPHAIPGLRTDVEQYVVQAGDTLGGIAQQYSISVEAIAEASDIPNINILEIGQVLTIPVPDFLVRGPSFKIIPDSELVAGPVTAHFNTPDYVYQQNGYLVRHTEDVDGYPMSGFQIVQRIAEDYSVNPRLLIALLEYQSGWVTNSNPKTSTLQYPLGLQDSWRVGLYRQLAWAADELNRGYYLWRVNGLSSWVLADGTVVPIDATINAGTAAVQHFFAQIYGQEIWQRTVNADGFSATYQQLFGYPFDYTYDPILPPDLKQPPMQLPFEPEVPWSFTGGPHGAWGDGSAWAALDFAPHMEPLGCVASDAWVVAVADGLIVRASDGVVLQDLDGDGLAQTGWVVLYMHIESRDRVNVGEFLHAGQRVGHPSCEGGISTGTHLHLARRYNGEWISADQGLVFDLDGWVSSGAGVAYDGFLTFGSRVIEAESKTSPESIIQR
ncbi:MAG: LysM peptidoglycan-binding domain-containing M23 family metallopeptidase [Chloroflexi bacterium]|nr:LysM peptidoglycan-binding domain-containing M23 family metallopeptidase [Chloroflexota bacterium]